MTYLGLSFYRDGRDVCMGITNKHTSVWFRETRREPCRRGCIVVGVHRFAFWCFLFAWAIMCNYMQRLDIPSTKGNVFPKVTMCQHTSPMCMPSDLELMMGNHTSK